MKVELTNEEVGVIRRALRFALDMGEDTYFAFFPDSDDYSDGDQDQDETARSVAQSLIDRLLDGTSDEEGNDLDEDQAEEIRFINHYQCPDDGTEWTDCWSCACNDKCPTCNKEIEPYESEEIDPPSEPLKSIDRPGPRKDARNSLRKSGA